MAEQSSADDTRGRVQKVLFLDDAGAPVAEGGSTQLPVDPFRSYAGQGLQEPPFSLEQLVYLAEQHPVHGAAIEQKAADVMGSGWLWKETKEDASEAEKEKLEEWLTALADEREDETVHEILLSAWEDLETVGHGCIEVARDPKGEVRHLYALPAHTTRFARDGLRLAQMRQGKRVWFKRWVPNDKATVHRVTGVIDENGKTDPKFRANEVLVIRRPARRSSWYGIPTYVAALGWIHLSLAARDDNILFFQNRREPRWAIILTNLDDDPDMEADLQQAFSVDLKQPHRNLVIPISGPGKVDFKQLSDTKGDMSFERLQSRADAAILAAHRTPGERLGLIASGPLGGNAVVGASRVYKEAVIQTSQAILAARVQRFVKAEAGIEKPKWLWTPRELDLTEETTDIQNASSAFGAGILRLNEAREMIGKPPLEEDDERGEMFITELVNVSASTEEGTEEAVFGAETPSEDLEEPITTDAATDEQIRELLGANGNGAE